MLERALVILVLYLRESGPMGGAPYFGPRLGDGPIFEVSVSQFKVALKCVGVSVRIG